MGDGVAGVADRDGYGDMWVCRRRPDEWMPDNRHTLDRSVAEGAQRSTHPATYDLREVRLISVASLLSRLGRHDVQFLSVDVEGLDADLLSNIDFSRFRPSLICIEANSMETRGKMRILFEKAGYDIVKEIECNLMAIPASS